MPLVDVKCKKLTTLKKSKVTEQAQKSTNYKHLLLGKVETSHDGIIQCTICLNWAHFKCAGIEEDDLEFVYDLC